MSLPTGTLTFFFTDIEGSSQLWEHHPETMQSTVIRHNDLLRAAIEGHGGHVVKFRGDGVFAVFAEAQSAALTALAAQESLVVEPWDNRIGQLKVRMGLHTGAAGLQDNDYYGPTVNRAARLEEAGHGGQILLSQVTQGIIRDTLPAEVELIDLGEHLIRDFPRPEHIYQLVSPQLDRAFPPLRSLSARRSNLPASPTPFIGREEELAALDELLANPEARLVTIIGPGGMGKTRLALASAEQQLEGGRFPDGVFFIPLAPLGEADLIPTTMAEAFDVPLESGRDRGQGPRRQVLDYLGQKRLLLVIDNFEHVLDGATFVAEIVQTAPGIQILATSRERLNLLAEQLYPIQGLHYPDWETPEDAADYAAVRLFTERARRVVPGFSSGADDLAYVSHICRRVAGMPLAIELAAAWVDTLSPEEIAAELQESLELLETDTRDVPERQQSIWAVFDTSWARLNKAEREILAQLSVFRGGFSRKAGQAVSGVTLRQLNTLTNKSLLQFSKARGRYEIHELLRQFSLEKLRSEEGAEDRARERHSQFYAAFMQDREAELDTLRDIEALDAIEAEIDNVRAGWERAVTQQQPDAIDHYLNALMTFYVERGLRQEGAETFAKALEAARKMDQGEQTLLLGRLLRAQGGILSRIEHQKGKALLDESLTILRRKGSPLELARLYQELGWAAQGRGELAEARRWFLEALKTYEASGRTSGAGTHYQDIAYAALLLGRGDEATRYLHKALASLEKEGPRRSQVWNYEDLGLLAHWRGAFEEADQYYQEGAQSCRELNLKLPLWALLEHLSEVAIDRGAYQEAAGHSRENLHVARELGNLNLQTGSLSMIGYAAILQGDLEGAEQSLRESRQIRVESGGNFGFNQHVHGELALTQERYEEASVQYRKSLTFTVDRSQTIYIIWSYIGLGKVALAQGAYDEGGEALTKALKVAKDFPIIPEILAILTWLATLLAQRGLTEAAVELLGPTLDHPGTKLMTKELAARLMAELKTELSPEVVEGAVSRGREQSLEQAVESALLDSVPPP